MSRLWKIVAGTVAVALLAGVLLVVLARVLITPERVKAVVVPLAEQALNRKVTLGEIRVGLFSGIELQALTVDDRAGGERLLSADLVRLRFQWLPLLAGRVVIDEVLLERPRIRLGRDAAGTLTIADLLGAAAGGQQRAAGGESGDSAITLLVSELRVSDGQLLFTDLRPDPAAPTRIEVTSVQAQLSGLTFDGRVPLQLRAVLNGAPLAIDGAIGLKDKIGKVAIDLQKLDLPAFEPYFRDRLPGRLGAGHASLQAEVERSPQHLAARGVLTVAGLAVRLAALPDAPLENATLRADFDVATKPGSGAAEFHSLKLDLNGLSLAATGRLSGLPDAPHIDLGVTVPGLDLHRALTALPAGLLGKAGEFAPSGLLRAEFRLVGTLDEPRQLLRQGSIVLDQVQASVAGVRPTLAGKLVIDGERARFEGVTVRLGTLVADVAGGIGRLLTGATAEMTVTVPKVDLAAALAKVPPELLAGVAGFAPSGQVAARARLSGPLSEPRGLLKEAELSLTDLQVTAAGQRPAVSGTLRLTGDRLASEGLVVRLGGNSAQVKVTAANLFGRPIVATADLVSQRFQIEPLLQGGGSAAAAGQRGAGSGGDLDPFDLPLQANGSLRIGETTWKGLAVRDFLAEYTLRDNQLTVSRMTGKVAGGSFSNRLRVDLRRPGLAYEADIALQGVQAEALLPALAPQAAETLFGVLELKTSLAARGTSWETISRSLSGDGAMTVADGRLVSPSLVKGLASYLHIADFDEIRFRDLRGKARVAAGQVAIDSALLGERLKLFPKGALGLDGSLNLSMDTRLSPELAARIDRRGQVVRFLADPEGWSQVPLLVTGTWQAPRFGIDPKGVQAQATRALQQELQRGIDKLLDKSRPAPPPVGPDAPAEPAPPPAPKPAQQLIEESLKQLLGR